VKVVWEVVRIASRMKRVSDAERASNTEMSDEQATDT
jgi:hypothetical protein